MNKQNYTKEQVAVIMKHAPFDFEGAKAIGDEIGKNPRSVAAKARSLEAQNPELKIYIKKPEYVTKTGQTVKKKEDIIADIEELLETSPEYLEGLIKSSKIALQRLQAALAQI